MISKIILLCLLFWDVTSESFPSGIPKCKYAESACIVRTINDIFRNKYSGLLGLQLDPLKISKMSINQGSESPINIKLEFKDVLLNGISSAGCYKASGFRKQSGDNDVLKIDIRFKAPVLTLSGPYKINGRVLVLPIVGVGQSNITLENIDITMKYITKKVLTDGKIYNVIDKKKFSFESSRLFIHLTNLFNGDKALGDNMNSFLNINWKDILKELKPAIIDAFGTVFKDYINGIFITYPYNEMFSE